MLSAFQTPYEGQRAYIVNQLQLESELPKDAYVDIEIANVDSFQVDELD